MSLLKPTVLFFMGYFLINYYNKYKKKIQKIKIIGNDLYKLTEKNRDIMLLLIISFGSYFI
jgi:hypothetical protein